MTSEGLFVLHDRRRPGTAANIDHLVVAPSGVWVIDAKRYSGLVTKTDRGRWFKADVRLTVGGHDRTKLIEGVHKQVSDVQRIVDSAPGPSVPVHGALCFIDAEFRLFAKPFTIDGVVITWGKALRQRLGTAGNLDESVRKDVFDRLRASSRKVAGGATRRAVPSEYAGFREPVRGKGLMQPPHHGDRSAT